MISPEQELIKIATTFIGTKEDGPNKGKLIELFQKAVDGKAAGESYCIGFCFYNIFQVDKLLGIKTQLFPTEHVLTCWNNSPKARLTKPQVGSLVIWQHYKKNVPTTMGHAGIVQSILPNQLITIEGNTSSGVGVNRDGDGVYNRTRSLTGTPDMRIKGFLQVWNPLNLKKI